MYAFVCACTCVYLNACTRVYPGCVFIRGVIWGFHNVAYSQFGANLLL